jgi:hypothetical protein
VAMPGGSPAFPGWCHGSLSASRGGDQTMKVTAPVNFSTGGESSLVSG